MTNMFNQTTNSSIFEKFPKIKYWQYFINKMNQICIMDYYNTRLIDETKYNAFKAGNLQM